MNSSKDNSDICCHAYDSPWNHPFDNQRWCSGAFLDGPPWQSHRPWSRSIAPSRPDSSIFSESDGPKHGASLRIQEHLYESLAFSAGRFNLLPLLSCKDVNLPTTARGCFCDWICFSTWHVKGPSRSWCHLAKVPAFLTPPRESKENEAACTAPCHTLALGIHRESHCQAWEGIQMFRQPVSGLWGKIWNPQGFHWAGTIMMVPVQHKSQSKLSVETHGGYNFCLGPLDRTFPLTLPTQLSKGQPYWFYVCNPHSLIRQSFFVNGPHIFVWPWWWLLADHLASTGLRHLYMVVLSEGSANFSQVGFCITHLLLKLWLPSVSFKNRLESIHSVRPLLCMHASFGGH